MTYPDELSARSIRYNLMLALIEDRGTLHNPDTLVDLMELFYDAIVSQDGEVVDFTVYEQYQD